MENIHHYVSSQRIDHAKSEMRCEQWSLADNTCVIFSLKNCIFVSFTLNLKLLQTMKGSLI